MTRNYSTGALLRLSAVFLMALLVPMLATFGQDARADDPPLGPIDPDNGEQTLLDLVNALPINDVDSALEQYPVPFITCATAGGAAVTCVTQKAGSPARVDADGSKSTGKGGSGQDIQVEVNTELFPTPHLVLTITRLGTSNFASNLQAVVAFPFDAFNDEDANPAGNLPNLFLGYRTTADFDNVAQDYPAGGIAPASVQFALTPDVLAGPNHLLDMDIQTVGADNPIQYLAGHFDGNSDTGIQDALALAALADEPPASMAFGLNVSQTLFASPATGTSSAFGLTYDGGPTKMMFSYIESEDFPFTDPDFGTTVTFDQMPGHEALGINVDFATRLLTLSHESNAPVGKITVEHKRRDGLEITGTASQVPTVFDATLDFSGTPSTALTIDVDGQGYGGALNPNTMDIDVIAKQEDGFPNSDAFLGYPIGYAQFALTDVPDMTAGFISATNSFGVAATNVNESIGAVTLVIGDDDDLELPPNWDAPGPWHIFSLIDDGTHGTAAARVVDLVDASLNLDANPTGETFNFELGSRSPMQLWLETTPDSQLTSEDILAHCEMQDMPEGTVDFTIDFPDQFHVDASPDNTQVIDSIICAGHVGTLNFELGVGHLPMNSGYIFDPNGELDVTVEPNGPNSDSIGFITARFWDEDNPLPSALGLGNLLGDLHDARLRVDEIPSFTATWSNGANTAIDFHTGIPDDNALFVDGVQLMVSSEVELDTPFPVADPSEDDFLTFADLGTGEAKRLGAGVFGLTDFAYLSNDGNGNMTVGYRANDDHKLIIDLDSRFGGHFFPNFDYDVTFTLDAIPATFDMTTNLSTAVQYTGSSGISSAVLDGFVDNSGPDLADKTHVQATISSLPSQFNLNVVPASGATLVTNDAGTMDISLSLDSDVSIFGSPYGLVEAALTGIPAKFTGDWSGGQFLLEFKDAADNPSKLGQASAKVSVSNDGPTNDAYLAEFSQPGTDLPGVVTTDATGCRVNYSEFLQEIDRRYHTNGSPSVLSRLNLLYCDAEILDSGEDHIVAVIAGGALQFASVQLSDLQKVAYQPDADGGHYELLIPTPGTHSLFAGADLDGNFLTAEISNVPDSLVLDIDTAAQVIDFTASEVVDEIDLYWGPMPMASDDDTALRGLIEDLPSSVHIAWGFGYPSGGVTFDASNEFELLVLFQNGGKRIAGGLQVEDLHLGYFVDFPSLNGSDFVCLVPPFAPDELCTDIKVPTALSILEATAGMDNDPADPQIVANPAKPGVDGFFALYDRIGSVANLTGTCPAACPGPGANEYVPLLTFLMSDFRELSVGLNVEVDPFPENIDVLGIIDIELEFNLVGNFVFDVWSSADTDYTIDTSDAIVGLIGFRNEPDYTENTPIHLVPGLEDPVGNASFSNPEDAVLEFNGFHGFGDHIDPFAP